MKDLKHFFKSIKLKPNKENLYHEAFVHRSYVNESSETSNNNERLEFLGDAVLELVVTEFLFKNYPSYAEGDLTSFRAALVRTESLAEEAQRLKLGEFIYMSNGEEATGGRNRPYILANTFEAIVGAIYLDKQYAEAERFILENVCYKIEEIISKRLDIDSKSKLQEVSQETLRITPAYELLSSSGPDHNKTFEMGVMIGDKLFAKAKGKSKQEAEQNAAEIALVKWEELIKLHFS